MPGCGEVPCMKSSSCENNRVCPRCDHHFALSPRERIANLCDPDSFVELDSDLTSIDTLKFQAWPATGSPA
jgi:acetyl-CoA carboxylase carboxyl transferase subunit beta